MQEDKQFGMDRKTRRQLTQDRQEGKKTDNSVQRKGQEDRQFRMDRKTIRQTTQNRQKGKNTSIYE
jgi:hypothetical protein